MSRSISATRREFTILDFAKLIIKLTGSKSKIIHEPLPVDDPKQRRPNITRAKELLGWEPKVKLEDGLATGHRILQRQGVVEVV